MVHRRTFLTVAAASAAAAGCRGTGGAATDIVSTPAPAAAAAPSAPAPAATAATPASPPISAATVAEAEKLAAVAYTPAERALILQSIGEQLDQIRALRGHALVNSDPPAVVFNPLLPGASLPTGPGRVRPARLRPQPVPANAEDIAFAPVTQLGAWLRQRKLTSVRLTEIYLERLERLGPKLECVVTLTRDRALAAARAADRDIARGRIRGPLHGIPYGAKDLFDTRGIRTTWGATPYKDRIADSDAAVIRRLDETGAVLVAKLTLGALAYGDIWFGGRTRNPWNTEEGSSGSSAGSAAATAAGLVGFSLGTETLGSIVSPSMRCGTTGLRPTFGRVARTGAMALCWSLDKIGPICRTVEDTALVLATINGADPGDPGAVTTVPFDYDGQAGVAGRKVGFSPAWFASDDAEDVDRAALAAARDLGLDLVEIELPQLPYQGLIPILLAEAAAAFEDLTLSNRDDELVWQDKEAWPNTFRMARFLSAVDLVQAERLRRQVMAGFADIFNRVEAIIAPSFAGPLLLATNFTGHPSLTLRAGFVKRNTRGRGDSKPNATDPLHEVPYGITLWGRLYREGRLCEIGRALERALGVWSQRPTLD